MATIRYQLHKQLVGGWTILAFDESKQLIQQVINVANGSAAIDLVKIHAGQNLPLLNLVNMVASEPQVPE